MYDPNILVDIYDESLSHIGNESKESVHHTGSWHKSIHCWIARKDSTGEYLLFQKRGAHKRLLPNFFDVTVAGHFELGETVNDAFREVTEELGVKTNFSDWKFLGVKFDVNKNTETVNKEFCETFIYRDDRELSEYILCEDEVDSLFQIPIDEGLRLFEGEIPSLLVQGIAINSLTRKWESVTFNVTKDLFIPRTDYYYSKMLVIAKLFLSGYKYLYV